MNHKKPGGSIARNACRYAAVAVAKEPSEQGLR